MRAALELPDLTSWKCHVDWSEDAFPIPDDPLYGMRVGIVESGACARAALRRISAFGAAVGVHEPFEAIDAGRTPSDLATLASWSDVLVLVDEALGGPHPWLGPEAFQLLGYNGLLVDASCG